MANDPQNPVPQMQVRVTDDTLGGTYSNNATIAHTREEFLLDFFSVFPPAGKLVARVIVSPSHMKRIVRVMSDSLKKYEEMYGTIPETAAPPTPQIVH
ncbi:MAG: DUF3467 domain-containing protein [Pseudomonadota bacterium]